MNKRDDKDMALKELSGLVNEFPSEAISMVGALLEAQQANNGTTRKANNTTKYSVYNNSILYTIEELFKLREEYYYIHKSDSLVGFLEYLNHDGEL